MAAPEKTEEARGGPPGPSGEGRRRAAPAVLLLCLALALCFAAFPAQAEQGPPVPVPVPQAPPAAEKKTVLILNSHQQGLPIPDSVVAGILTVLRGGNVSVADIYVEHLDLLRFNSPEHRAELAEYLRDKMDGRHIDLIVTITKPALDFLADEAKDLFPDAPVLAAIVPADTGQEISSRKLAIIPWRLDSAGTLRYALKLFPMTRRVVVVTGGHDEFLPYLSDAKKDFAAWKDRLTFEYTTDLTYPDMLKRISELPEDSVVIYSPYFSDKTGRSFIPAEVATAVAKAADVPAFAMVDTFIRDGFVGGSMLSSKDIGEQAGRLARDILAGKTRLSDRTTVVPPSYFPMFDWRQLKGWGVDEGRLPQGSVIIDRPPTLWGQYKAAVLGVLGASIVLLALVVALALQNLSRKRAEYSARMSEARYRVLFEHAPDAILVFDADEERIVDANTNSEALFGSSREELLRWGTWRFPAPARADGLSIEESMRLHRGQILEQGTATFEQAIHTAAGKDVLCEVRLAKLPSMGNTWIRASFLDITERKQAEAALRESAFKFQGLFEHSPLGMILMDARGVVFNANPAFGAVFGVPSETYLGLNLLEAMGDERHKASLARGLREGSSQVEAPYASFVNDRHLTLKATVNRIFSNLFLLVVEDVTEIHRLQEAMVQNEKMMSVGGLAAGMAHEINNPLSGIMQSVQVVKKRVTDDLPANLQAAAEVGCELRQIHDYLERREVLAMIDAVAESAKRAAVIVKNMLEFSRKSESVLAPADMNALLDKSLELSASDYDLKKKYDFRKIAIERDYASELPGIFCNASRLEQVFLNLLQNAAQAMAGSAPGAAPPRITLRTRDEGDAVRIEVEDNGPGMDPKTRRRIFEPFFTTKMQGEGTGLGLSVSYFIITNTLGGTIEVESQPGQGTKFVIRLPVHPDLPDLPDGGLAPGESGGPGEPAQAAG